MRFTRVDYRLTAYGRIKQNPKVITDTANVLHGNPCLPETVINANVRR
jgi:hypothetical protein